MRTGAWIPRNPHKRQVDTEVTCSSSPGKHRRGLPEQAAKQDQPYHWDVSLTERPCNKELGITATDNDSQDQSISDLHTHTGKKVCKYMHTQLERKTNCAGEVPYLLRALVLIEDPVWIWSIHNYLSLQFQNTRVRHTCEQNTHTHKVKFKKI